MGILCIYHRDCLDGFAAAWAVHRAFPSKSNVVEFWPAGYGEAPPSPDHMRDKEVLIVDFSYPADTLKIMGEVAASVIVLDHHEKAEKELRDFPKLEFSFRDYCSDKYPKGIHVRFDMKQSGAGLTWRWVHGGKTLFSKANGAFAAVDEPDIITYVEDRDLWLFEYKDLTREFCAALGATPFSFGSWDDICDRGGTASKELRAAGKIILQSQAKMIEAAISSKNMQLFCIGGFHVPTFAISEWSGIISEALNEAAKAMPAYPFVASYHDSSEGRKFSLRSDKNNNIHMNVNLIANKYGGGGHPNASGFRAPRGWMGDTRNPLGDLPIENERR